MAIAQTESSNTTRLRNALNAIPARDYQDIREAYYKAVEGLRALADALEVAESDEPYDGRPGSPLMAEHLNAVAASKALDNSLLGIVL